MFVEVDGLIVLCFMHVMVHGDAAVVMGTRLPMSSLSRDQDLQGSSLCEDLDSGILGHSRVGLWMRRNLFFFFLIKGQFSRPWIANTQK